MNARAQEAFQLFESLKELEQRALEIQAKRKVLEESLDELFVEHRSNVLAINQPNLGASARRGRVASENSSQKRIERLLNGYPDADFDGGMVAHELKMNIGTARTNLSKMVTLKLIEKRSPNTYGAIRQDKEAPKEEAS